MTEEEFSELSAKVLIGEATEEEVASHRSACEENEEFGDAFEDMKTASGILGENAPYSEAMDSKDPEIPELLLEQLVDEVAEKKSSSEPQVGKDDNLVNFWVKLSMPIAAVLAIVFFINRGGETDGDVVAGGSPVKPTPTNPADGSYEVASLGVEFGRWKDEVVRGENEDKDWVPDSIEKSYFENKTERNEWIDGVADKIRVWIDEDEAKIMILRPGQKQADPIDLLFEPDKQKSQLVELMKALSFPREGVRHEVLESDTLSGIAETHGSTIDWILNANGLNAENPLVPGSRIFIPKPD
jgi:hypothetical protein